MVIDVPVGKVKWYDPEKGFGFVSNPGDEDVYVNKAVLPDGVEEIFQGQRIDYDFAAGRRGPQVLQIRSVGPSNRRAVNRRKPAELASMLSDVLTVIETRIQPPLSKGRYPERKEGRQVAEILRAVAKELDA